MKLSQLKIHMLNTNFWCDWGIESLEFAEDLLTGHLAETFTGAPAALAWIDARFDGKTPIQGCLHTTRLTNLLYPNTLILLPVLPWYLPSSFRYPIRTRYQW